MAEKRPLVITSGLIQEIAEGDTIPVEIMPPAITADLELYVDTAGDDVTGDGSIGNPYLTIIRAAEHYLTVDPGNFFINIHINAGVHDCDEKFTVIYPFGGKLRWLGESASFATPTIANIDGAASTDANFAGLEYIDFDLTLTGLADSPTPVGMFVHMDGCTGGTNPQGLNGLHEIVAWDGGTDVATCRVWRRLNTTELPSGAITVSKALLIKSVLQFTDDDHGIDVRGPYEMGDWDAIVIRGNATAYGSAKRGVRLFNGASLRSATDINIATGLCLHEWGVAGEIVGDATYYSQLGAVSKCNDQAMQISVGGTVRFTGSGNAARNRATINGCDNRAFLIDDHGILIADSLKVHSSAGAVTCQMGSFAELTNLSLHYDQGAETGVLADDMGRVVTTGATIVGFATDYSPTADTFGNNGSFIGTA